MNDKDYFQFGIEGLSEAIDRFDQKWNRSLKLMQFKGSREKL